MHHTPHIAPFVCLSYMVTVRTEHGQKQMMYNVTAETIDKALQADGYNVVSVVPVDIQQYELFYQILYADGKQATFSHVFDATYIPDNDELILLAAPHGITNAQAITVNRLYLAQINRLSYVTENNLTMGEGLETSLNMGLDGRQGGDITLIEPAQTATTVAPSTTLF